MPTARNKAVVRAFLEEIFNRGNLDAADGLIAADVIDHHSPPGFAPGLEGAKQLFGMLRLAFPDLRTSVDDVIAEGDKVVAHGTLRGTHQGAFLGVPPTGKPMTLSWIDVYRVVDGKVVEVWHVEDFYGMLQQLGAIPAPGQVGT
jgi:steroid delta-isomerase-like uncharacterized protein